jgi:lipopolysaccharide/colanic/teichoic acid biosynthesis glycosyltransferase
MSLATLPAHSHQDPLPFAVNPDGTLARLMARRSQLPISTNERPFPKPVEATVNTIRGPLEWAWSRGFRFLFPLDALTLYGLMVAINTARFGFSWPDFPISRYLVGFAIATAVQLFVNYLVGLYERENRLGVRPWLPRTALAAGIGVAGQGLAFVILDRYLMPRLNLVVFFVLASLLLAGNRRWSRALARRRQGAPTVILVGDEQALELALAHLVHGDREARVVASVTDVSGIAGAIDEFQATDVLLLDVAAFEQIYPDPLDELERMGIGFLQRVSARDTLLGLRSVREVGGMPFVPLRTHTVPNHKLVQKRLFDLVIVVALSPLWLLALAGLWVFVRLRAGSPAFYRQERVGRDGVNFSCLKFRTMVVDAERDGPQLADRTDERIVPGLSWMRETRADEMPQLINVLKGEMSLVGPRPERPALVDEISQRLPGYLRRLELPPGLTGLAQVNGRYHTDAEFKLGYDIQYLVNLSLAVDLEIMLRTVWVVLSRRQ